MKFCRRTEGTAAARAAFKKAREDPRTTHHAYAAAALMEYYCTKDKKVAANVFELGFKKFKHVSTSLVNDYFFRGRNELRHNYLFFLLYFNSAGREVRAGLHRLPLPPQR